MPSPSHGWPGASANAPTAASARCALLDAADALEARLRAARGEIEAIAGDHENPVRGAMQEILRQRLWLQENAHTAALADLDAVRRSLDSARDSLEQQLQRVAQARAGH